MEMVRGIFAFGAFAAVFAASPVSAVTVDLTTAGACTPITAANIASCSIGGAVFTQALTQPTGTGVTDSFDRLEDGGIEQGMNTDASGVYDNKAGAFTHAIHVNEFGIVQLLGVDYVRFLLDINESSGHDNEFLVLDRLKIVTTPASGSFSTIEDAAAAPGPEIYELNAGNTSGPNVVQLNYALNNGSGSGDMFIYIPASLFSGQGSNFLYLYSQFGNVNAVTPALPDGYSPDAGFEEWARVLADGGGAGGDPVPEPSQLPGLLAAGIAIAIALRRRRAAPVI
jgi:hypothetical protein